MMRVDRGVRSVLLACGAEGDFDDEAVAEVALDVQSKCGNGQLNAGEPCDDGNRNNSDRCTNQCKVARCGDGILQSGEQCEDRNKSNNDACLNTCKAARCGDGFVYSGREQCDDANANNNDRCTNACRSH